MSTIRPYEERIQWFHQARFGMFIHWGLYSLLARGEWVMLRERSARQEYARLAKRFKPARFDPKAWANLAAEAGMKYMVLTSRHHDGFCLFDSKVSDFTAPRSAARRDIVAEFTDACRQAGLRVGLYYSLLDWRFEGYFEPVRYPDSAQAMVRQAHDQVRELLTNYGRIDLLWYDGHWLDQKKAGVADVADFWRSRELSAMVRSLQPDILINNRSGLAEDLDTPEQHVTASAAGRGWESCMTMGDSCGWGYIRHNPNFKPVPQLLQNLVEAAAGEGNYLLNCGPKPDGTIRAEEVVRLRAMGAWLKTNGEAVYGSQRCALDAGMLGRWTRNGNTAYLHLFRYPGRVAVVPLVGSKPESADLLVAPAADGQAGSPAAIPLQIKHEYNGRMVLSGLPLRPPHPSVNTIRVRFAEEPRRLEEPDAAAWLAGKA